MEDTHARPVWSVALSGGGHRASLYAAGALLAMVDGGVNKQVRTITSVSGGSLTNGVLAQADTPFCEMEERDDLLKVLDRLLYRATYKGTVEIAPEVVAWLLGVVLLVGGGTWLEVDHRNGPVIAAGVVAILAGLWLFSSRSWVADLVLRRLLFSPSGRATLLEDAEPEPGRGRSAKVLHIFCTSELQSRLHAYFSKRFIYNHDFGVSTSFGTLPLSTAVQVSSNFPPVFPARRLRAKKLGLSTRESATLWLSDGGVYDNMAEEWVTGAFSREAAERDHALDALDGPDAERLLVVNASKRDDFSRTGWLSRIPVLGELFVLVSLTNLMHQVTTTNRRSRLVDEFNARQQLSLMEASPAARRDKLERAIGLPGELIHIATRADELASKVPDATDGPFAKIREAFGAIGKPWLDESHEMALRVGTRLNKTQQEPAAALLWQAHALTQVSLLLAGEIEELELMSKDEVIGILATAKARATQK